MDPNRMLTVLGGEVYDGAYAKCPEFGMSVYDGSFDKAKNRLMDSVRTVAYEIVDRSEHGLSVDDELLPFAKLITQEADFKRFFLEKHI
jgi:hypothetical protein